MSTSRATLCVLAAGTLWGCISLFVRALDAAGLESRTTNCTFEVRWPGLVQSGPDAVLAFAATNVLFSFANTGSIPLELSFALAPVGFADDMEGGPGGNGGGRT